MHNDGLHNVYSWPDIFRMTKQRRKRWTWYAARMTEKRSVCKFLVGILKGKSLPENTQMQRG
jgi:hypothetical protein